MDVGEKVKGKVPPHGGKWEYDPETDELTLLEKPTAPADENKGVSNANQ